MLVTGASAAALRAAAGRLRAQVGPVSDALDRVVAIAAAGTWVGPKGDRARERLAASQARLGSAAAELLATARRLEAAAEHREMMDRLSDDAAALLDPLR